MAYSFQTLELTIVSAKDLSPVNIISKMDVYAVATLSGDPRTKQRTPTDREGHKNPSWNATFRFSIPDNLDHSSLSIDIVIRADRTLGDREIGQVHIPIAELESDPKSFESPQFASYQVLKPDGKPKGVLNISYKFADPVTATPSHPPSAPTDPYLYAGPFYPPPPTGYPPAAYASPPPPVYYPPSQAGTSVYPPPSPPLPPPPTAYPPPSPPAGYPPPAGYAPVGYAPPPPAGYPQPVVQPAQTPPKKSSKLGMGLGAGLLGGAIGGLLLGEVVSDVVDFDF